MLTFNLRPNSPGFDPDVAADIAEFEQMMADAGTPVTVDLQHLAGPNAEYTTKNTLELRSGQGPDLLFEETGRSQNFMRAGFLMPLDDYVADWELWDQVIEPFRRWMGYDGHVYMIPIQSSAIPLYYRKDLFAQAGLPTEWQPTSWQEILDAAEQIKASLPEVTPLLFIGGKEAGGQVTFSRFNLLFNGAGGLLYDYDDEKWIVTSQPLLDVFESTRPWPSAVCSTPSAQWAGRPTTGQSRRSRMAPGRSTCTARGPTCSIGARAGRTRSRTFRRRLATPDAGQGTGRQLPRAGLSLTVGRLELHDPGQQHRAR